MKKQTLIILCILLIGLLGMISYQNSQNSALFSEHMVQLIPGMFHEPKKIIISRGASKEQISLEKKDSSWILGNPYNEVADTERIEEIITQIKKIQVGKPISESAEKFTQFKLDDTSGTKVELWSKNNETAQFYIGKISEHDYNHTFVRRGGEEKAYLAEDPFEGVFNTPGENFRSKNMLDDTKKQTTEIVIKRGTKKTTLSLADNFWKNEKGEDKSVSAKELLSMKGSARISEKEQTTLKTIEVGKLYFKPVKEGEDATVFIIKQQDKNWYLQNTATKTVLLMPNSFDELLKKLSV